MATITYTISDEKLNKFKTAFLRNCPVPPDASGEPAMSDNEWIKESGRLYFYHHYKSGKEKLAAEAADIDSIIIE